MIRISIIKDLFVFFREKQGLFVVYVEGIHYNYIYNTFLIKIEHKGVNFFCGLKDLEKLELEAFNITWQAFTTPIYFVYILIFVLF